MELKQTSLHQQCLKEGAKMVPFSGWKMPIQFSGLLKEHTAVRKDAGLFDISHMGAILLKGDNPKDALQQLVPSDLFRIGPGEACYTVLLNESGGVLDDLIVYHLREDENGDENLLLIINAACNDADIQWISKKLESKNISIIDGKKDGILLALQGPNSKNILEKILGPLPKIPRFGHQNVSLDKTNLKGSNSVFIARTGYTGEDGFELLLNRETGQNLWDELIQANVSPCGLGSRDTLRLEAAMHLYGNEMDTTTTPFEAGLGWLVHLEKKENFIGREILEKQATNGIQKCLVGLKLNERAIARKGYPVIHKGQIIGKITSGSWSPSLKAGIAMAYLPIELAKVGLEIKVDIRGEQQTATIVKRPFYKRTS